MMIGCERPCRGVLLHAGPCRTDSGTQTAPMDLRVPRAARGRRTSTISRMPPASTPSTSHMAAPAPSVNFRSPLRKNPYSLGSGTATRLGNALSGQPTRLV